MNGFEKHSNYNENTSFSSVVFGANKPLLEVEMNELQQIVTTKLSRVIKAFGSCVLPLADDSLVFNKDTKVLTVKNTVILEESGLTAYVQSVQVTLSNANKYAYFKVEEVDVTRTDTLKAYGNTAGATVSNPIQDSRSPVETTRRKAVCYTLMCGAEVPSNTDTAKYVEVGSFNSDLNSFVDEYKVTPVSDLGLSLNESGEMCVTFEEE